MSIIGNYDLKVLRFPKKKEKWKNSKHPEKFFAFQWAYENLSEESRRYMAALPKQIRLEGIGKKSILITHGSPASNEESLTSETPKERMQELAHIAQADMIIFGHSHRHFIRQVDDVWFINTGTVGRPDEGDPRACYAILEVHKNEFQVEHHHVDYDIQRAVAAIREKGLPNTFAEMIQQGYDLNTILGVGT
jgi:predicted phosphodiesterase